MKAVKLEKPWMVDVVDIEKPQPKEGEALIKIFAASICGSDIGAFRGTNGLVSYPRIIGHELAGEVISIPKNKRGIKPGSRVVVDPYLYCGHCYPCSIGRTNCCTDLKVLGVHIDGGMSEYYTHPSNMLVPIPDEMSWELASLAEPLTISLHGLHRLNLTEGEHIALFGAGPIGMMAALAALHYKAVPIMIDLVAERLQMAEELGVKRTVNLKTDNLVEKIKDITNGRMCECVMEVSGASNAIRSSLDIVSNAGRIAFTGWPKKETPLPTDLFTKKEIDIRGARTSAGKFDEAIKLINEARVDVGALVTKIIRIDEAADVIRDIEKNPGNFMKVTVTM